MLAHLLRQLLWREEVDRLQRELADQEAVEKAAREMADAHEEAVRPKLSGGIIP